MQTPGVNAALSNWTMWYHLPAGDMRTLAFTRSFAQYVTVRNRTRHGNVESAVMGVALGTVGVVEQRPMGMVSAQRMEPAVTVRAFGDVDVVRALRALLAVEVGQCLAHQNGH